MGRMGEKPVWKLLEDKTFYFVIATRSLTFLFDEKNGFGFTRQLQSTSPHARLNAVNFLGRLTQ